MPKHNRKKKTRKRQSTPFSVVRNQEKLQHQSEQKCPRKLEELNQRNSLHSEKKLSCKVSERTASGKPKFQQLLGETEYQFIKRMNEEVNVVIAASKHIPHVQPEDDVSLKKKKEKSRQRSKQRLAKKKSKLQSKLLDISEKEKLKDVIKFGEVVSKPPELKAKPRKANLHGVASKRSFHFLNNFVASGNEFVVK